MRNRNTFSQFIFITLLALSSPLLPISHPLLVSSALAKTTLDLQNELTQLIKEGQQNLKRGQLQEALNKFQKAQKLAKKIDSPWEELEVLLKIGEVYLVWKQPKNAQHIFRQALTISKKYNVHWRETYSLFEIGQIYLKKAYFEQAQKYFLQFLTNQKTDDYQNDRNDIEQVWKVYLELNYPNKALELFQQILVSSQQRKERQRELDTSMVVGKVYLHLKQFDQALGFFQQALTIAQEIEKRWEEREALIIIGDVYLRLNQPSQAQAFFLKFLALSNKIDERQGQREALRIIYETYLRLNQIDRSEKLFLQTIATYQKIGDYPKEAEFLVDVGEFYLDQKQLIPSRNFFLQALTVYQKIGDSSREAATFIEIGNLYLWRKQLTHARNFFLQAPVVYRKLQNSSKEAETFVDIGTRYLESDQLKLALEFFLEALNIQRKIGDLKGEVNSLESLGEIYGRLEQYQKAIEVYQQSLKFYKKVSNRVREAVSLVNLGRSYQELKEYDRAIKFYQLALPFYNRVGTQKYSYTEADVVRNLGISYYELGEYNSAINLYNRFLAKIPSDEARTISEILTLLGQVYLKLGQVQKGNELQKQSRRIAQPLGSRAVLPYPLNELGDAYLSLGQYERAIEFYLSALNSRKHPIEQAGALNNLGITYAYLGQYQKAISYYQTSQITLNTYKNSKNEEYKKYDLYILRNSNYYSISSLEATIFGNLANTYYFLGKYQKAIELHHKSLSIARQINDLKIEASSLNNLGNAYVALKQYQKALNFYQYSLPVFQKIQDSLREANCLNNLGNTSFLLGQYQKAIDFHQQALNIERKIQNRQGEGEALNNLGNTFSTQGKYKESLEMYQQSLVTLRDIGDRRGESISLNNIGLLLEKQNQPELAIVFYKQSVNLHEGIRQDIRTLPREQQESYTQTIADTYRNLTDLLLSQGRLLEAQQVLELLKIQELRDFTRNARAGGETSGIALARIEEEILKKYGTLIAFGQKVYECEQKKCGDLSQIRDQLDVLTQKFQQDTNAFRKTLQDRLAKDPALLEPEQLRNTAAKIVTAEPDTILIYPLVLKDKIRILIAARAGEKGVIFRTFETPINQQQLWQTVSQFRIQLASPNGEAEVKATSQKLYNWLIKPLEGELKNQNVRHLVFSLDRSTRYIPMTALFNGQQYLIERYKISTVLNAGLTDVKDRLPRNKQDTQVLAMGVSKAFPGFDALLNVPQELANIVQQSGNSHQGIFPGVRFLDKAFDFRALRDNLTGNKILHIATHGKFESGRPENSFLLSGVGDKLTVQQIQTLQNYMGDTHLVVLSACETALGGADADGIEISGMSFYFLTNGAKAVIASLWQVNDSSTSQLMQQFYQNLSTNMTKAEALRQAQLSLIAGKNKNTATSRSSVNYTQAQSGQAASISRNLSHPFYWAPFILIGNGL